MLSAEKQLNKVINSALLSKKYTDAHWAKTFALYKDGKVSSIILAGAMELTNTIDKEIIEIYGLSVFLSTFSKDKGWFFNG